MTAKVITFYSYKGGVGRTQALANIAVVLVNRGFRVVIADLDLESPGLHAFFSPLEAPARRYSDEDFASSTGLLEFLEECQQEPIEPPEISSRLVRCTHEALLPDRGTLRLLPAGRMDASYPTRVSSFSWEHFYNVSRGAECMEFLRDRLCEADADFVLIDSRTGVTDVGSVCTFQLPDLVVVLFALHRQGIDGARRVGAAIAESRAALGGEGQDARKRQVLFLPTRVIEEDSSDRRDEWIGSTSDALHPYGRILSRTGERIPHSLQVAYGEQVVVFPESDDHLAVAYQRLSNVILGELGHEETARPIGEAASAVTLLEVRRQFGRANQYLSNLSEEFSRLSRDQSTLSSVLGWAQRLVQIPPRLGAALHRLGQMTSMLLSSVSEVLEPPLLERPDSLREWEELVSSYEEFVDRAALLYRRGLAAEVRRRLLVAADQDILEVDQIWREVEPQLADEQRIDELLAAVPGLEQRLKQGTLQVLLKQNRLEQSDFERRGYTSSIWLRWLDERLEKVEDTDLEEKLEPILFNLLRLRALHNTKSAPTAIHWARYDFLCLFVEQNADGQAAQLDSRYFEKIGQHLWRTAWNNCLSAAPGEPLNFEPQAGASCRAQLQRLTDVQLDLVAADIATGLLAHAESGQWMHIARLLTTQRNDLLLRRALHLVSTPNPAIRRRLLALWLQDTHPGLEPQLFARYLQSLIEQQQSTLALLGLAALLEETPEIEKSDQRRLFDGVYIHAIIELLQTGRTSVAERLLDNLDFLARLEQIRAGRLLLVALCGGFCATFPAELANRLYSTIRYRESFRGFLPPAVEFHLQNKTRGLALSPGSSQRLLDAYKKAQAETHAHMYGHGRFQYEFQQYFEAKLSSLLSARRPQSLLLGEIDRMDPDSWIDSTLRQLMDAGRIPRNRPPDAGERKSFLLAFNSVRDRMREMVSVSLPTGTTTLAEQLDAINKANEARRALEDMLNAPPTDPQLDVIRQLL